MEETKRQRIKRLDYSKQRQRTKTATGAVIKRI